MRILAKSICFSIYFTALHLSAEPIPGAQQLIDELGLKESATPISEHPNWQPKKILFTEVREAKELGNIQEMIKQIAGDVEVEFIPGPGFQIDPETLIGADALLGWCTSQTLYDADSSLLWVHNFGVGMERCGNLDNELTRNRVFTNNQKMSGPGIAEHAIAMLMGLARNIPMHIDNQRNKNWLRSSAAKVSFGELSDKTVLVAGLGGIGSQIAKRANALGMRVIATRNSSKSGPDYVEYVGLSNELNTLAAQADVVINTLPSTNKTRGVFDKTFFNQMKSGSIYISIGRGNTTVTDDLINALQSGKLYGAGLDVTDPEPLPKDSPLWGMENVIITPHISGAGSANIYRSAVLALENLRRYIEGEPLLNIVDMAEGY